jgi:hypothetical protein
MKLMRSWFRRLHLWWWGIHNRDLGHSILKYMSESPDEIGYPVSLRDFLKLVGAKPWHAIYTLDGLEKEGYVEYEGGSEVDYHDVTTMEMAEGNSEAMPMEHHHMSFVLTRKGFLHYADMKHGASVVQLHRWQIWTFWVLLAATVLQTCVALENSRLNPWREEREQTLSPQDGTMGLGGDKPTDDDSTQGHPTPDEQTPRRGIVVLCGHCDTLGSQTTTPQKHRQE